MCLYSEQYILRYGGEPDAWMSELGKFNDNNWSTALKIKESEVAYAQYVLRRYRALGFVKLK